MRHAYSLSKRLIDGRTAGATLWTHISLLTELGLCLFLYWYMMIGG